jgi:hypothetical protein
VTTVDLPTATRARLAASSDGFDDVVDRTAVAIRDAVAARQFQTTVTLPAADAAHWFRLRKLLQNLGYAVSVEGDRVDIDWRG